MDCVYFFMLLSDCEVKCAKCIPHVMYLAVLYLADDGVVGAKQLCLCSCV